MWLLSTGCALARPPAGLHATFSSSKNFPALISGRCPLFRRGAKPGWVRSPVCSGKGFGTDIPSAPKPDKGKKSKKSKSDHVPKSWDFEDLMILWDEVFERSCEKDVQRIQRIWRVAQDGYRVHGRGCVVLTDEVVPVNGDRTVPNGDPDSDLILLDDSNLPTCLSKQWNVKYLPRTLLLELVKFTGKDSLNPASEEDSRQAAPKVDTKSVPLVTVDSLIPIIRSLGGDFSRLLTMTAEASPEVGVSQSPVESLGTEPDALGQADVDLGSESPYDVDTGEVAFVLVVNFDGQKVSGADVLEPCLEIEGRNVPLTQLEASGSGSVQGFEMASLRYRLRGIDDLESIL